jgi:hypothetical protein
MKVIKLFIGREQIYRLLPPMLDSNLIFAGSVLVSGREKRQL